MKKRIASILASTITAGLVGAELVKIYILTDSTPAPDTAGRHTVPVLIAPEISRSWEYATNVQAWLLAGLTATVLGCMVAWAMLTWIARHEGTGEG
jgi:hypothetical protein